MGGTLTRAPTGGVPSFLIQVAKDPLEANLERVQMIKGWLDASGKTHQKVVDIALSEGRTLGPHCNAPQWANTVDVTTAT